MDEKTVLKSEKNIDFSKFRQLGLVAFIVIISIVIQSRSPKFLSYENFNDLVRNASILGILAIGMAMVIITGGIDLSIGSTIAFSGMATSLFVAANPSSNPVVAIAMGVAIGLVLGSVVGFAVGVLKVLPIIASLGMMNIYRGLTYILSKGQWVSAYQMPDWFKNIGTGGIEIVKKTQTSPGFGISYLIVAAIIVFVVAYYFLNYTRTGRKIYAVGSNGDAARISGIDVTKVTIMVYSIMGALAGLAGVLWVAKFASAQGDTAAAYEVNVIAACVLGGVSVEGGSGKILGIFLGTLLLGIIQNALPLVPQVSPFAQDFIKGVIIVFAIILNTLVKRKMDRNNLVRRKI